MSRYHYAERFAVFGLGVIAPATGLVFDFFPPTDQLHTPSAWQAYLIVTIICLLCCGLLGALIAHLRGQQRLSARPAGRDEIIAVAIELIGGKLDQKTEKHAKRVAQSQDGLFTSRYIQHRLIKLKRSGNGKNGKHLIKLNRLPPSSKRLGSTLFLFIFAAFVGAVLTPQLWPTPTAHWSFILGLGGLPLWWLSFRIAVLAKLDETKEFTRFSFTSLPVIPRRRSAALPSQGSWHMRSTTGGLSALVIAVAAVLLTAGVVFLSQQLGLNTTTQRKTVLSEQEADPAPTTPKSASTTSRPSSTRSQSTARETEVSIPQPSNQPRPISAPPKTIPANSSRIELDEQQLNQAGRKVADVHSALNAVWPRLQQWFKAQRKTNHLLQGHVQFQIRIGPQGWVENCVVMHNETNSKSFVGGLVDRIESTIFPPAYEAVDIIYTVHFHP